MPTNSPDIDGVFQVRAGKFRRYHGESWLARLFDVPTNLKNLRDLFYVGIGLLQSLRMLRRVRPDVVFIKGSAVGVPIGKACHILGIPYFTHDSDSVASLTNRLLAKHAVYHAVGLPLSFYSRADATMRYTGIPLAPVYRHVTKKDQTAYREVLSIPKDALLIAVTGGSLGAQRLNQAVVAVAEGLLRKYPNLHIFHQTGVEKGSYDGLVAGLQSRVHAVDYTKQLDVWTGAADLVIARAGATTIAELAVQGKACLFVPNPQLTGGQQTHNAHYLDKQQAAVIVSESEAADSTKFEQQIVALLDDQPRRESLAAAMHRLAKTDAADEITAIIVELAVKHKHAISKQD